jgi:lysophospholipase L1-like esterase
MISVALHFASGNSLFTGTALLLAALGLRVTRRRPWCGPVARLVLATGLLCIGLSSTPLWWPLSLWWGLSLAWVWRVTSGPWVRSRKGGTASAGSVPSKTAAVHPHQWGAVALTVGVSLVACAQEASTFLLPATVQPPAGGFTRLYVIGDSLSALGNPPWPMLLAEHFGVPVVNLAVPGATVLSAARQTSQVPRGDPALVIVLIGGNDQFAGRSASDFRRGLSHLLAMVHRRGHRVILVELPLLPGRHGYGYAQRGLAREFDALLISKRELAEVLASSASTVDGLHLSQEGHRELALRLARLLALAFGSSDGSSEQAQPPLPGET